MEKNKKNIKKIKFDKAALQLLKDIGKENKRVKNFLIRKYRGLPVSPEAEEEAYNYFLANSILLSTMTTFPGSSFFTEFLYEEIPSLSAIDKYVFHCKAGKAIKSRLFAMEKELPKIIEDYRLKGKVLIGNLGSGPGRDVINVFSAKYRDSSDIKAVNVDKDVNSLRRGETMAKVKKIGRLIKFVRGNFLKYSNSSKFDILILIGVLCPLDFATCVYVLKKIKNILKKGGCIIASNATKEMEREDPFAYFIMKWMADWKLVFKDEKELKLIYKKAGYVWKKGFSDSYGFHLMGVGTFNS